MELCERRLVAFSGELEGQVVQSRIVADDHHRIDVLTDLVEPIQDLVCVSAVEVVGDEHLGLVARAGFNSARVSRAHHADEHSTSAGRTDTDRK